MPLNLKQATTGGARDSIMKENQMWKKQEPQGKNLNSVDDLAGKNGVSQPQKSYKQAVSNSVQQPKCTLTFKTMFDAKYVNDVLVISPPVDFLKESRLKWNTSVIGFFLGYNLAYTFVREQAFAKWGGLGLEKVFTNKKFYTLKFKSENDKDAFLAAGPYHIGNKTFFVQPWIEGTNFTKEAIARVPHWIKFHNIPTSYWCEDGLSYIASSIGKPVAWDKETALMEPMNFARICVEVSVNSQRPKTIVVPVLSDEDLSIVQVPVLVEFGNLPPACTKCKVFGHSLAKCRHTIACSAEPAAAEPVAEPVVAEPVVEHVVAEHVVVVEPVAAEPVVIEHVAVEPEDSGVCPFAPVIAETIVEPHVVEPIVEPAVVEPEAIEPGTDADSEPSADAEPQAAIEPIVSADADAEADADITDAVAVAAKADIDAAMTEIMDDIPTELRQNIRITNLIPIWQSKGMWTAALQESVRVGREYSSRVSPHPILEPPPGLYPDTEDGFTPVMSKNHRRRLRSMGPPT